MSDDLAVSDVHAVVKDSYTGKTKEPDRALGCALESLRRLPLAKDFVLHDPDMLVIGEGAPGTAEKSGSRCGSPSGPRRGHFVIKARRSRGHWQKEESFERAV